MRKRTVSLKVDLYRLIKKHGYNTLTEFANALHVTPGCISQIVNGQSGSTRAFRKTIATRLGTTPERIWHNA